MSQPEIAFGASMQAEGVWHAARHGRFAVGWAAGQHAAVIGPVHPGGLGISAGRWQESSGSSRKRQFDHRQGDRGHVLRADRLCPGASRVAPGSTRLIAGETSHSASPADRQGGTSRFVDADRRPLSLPASADTSPTVASPRAAEPKPVEPTASGSRRRPPHVSKQTAPSVHLAANSALRTLSYS